DTGDTGSVGTTPAHRGTPPRPPLSFEAFPKAPSARHNTVMSRQFVWSCALSVALALLLSAAAQGAEKSATRSKGVPVESTPLERVRFRDESMQPREVAGRVVIEADDGGLVVLGQDGRLWTVEKPQLQSRDDAGEPFRALSFAAMGRQ